MPTSNEDTVVYFIEPSGTDGQFVSGVDDLKPQVIETVAAYAARKQKEGGQTYKILNDGLTSFSITDGNNNPQPIVPTRAGAQKVFVDPDNSFSKNKNLSDAYANFQNSSDSGNIPELNVLVKKGKSSQPTGYDGNELLPTVPDKIINSINNGISQKNKFHQNVEGDATKFASESQENGWFASVQTTLGEYNSNSPELKIEELRKVGLALMLKASGEVVANTAEKGTFNPDNAVSYAATTSTPGIARLGVPVEAGNLRASEALSSVSKAYSDNYKDTDFQKDNRSSYGNTNNQLVPFSNNPIASSIMAAALYASLEALIGSLATLFSLGASVNVNAVRSTPILGIGIGRQEQGQFTKVLFNYLNIKPTVNNYGLCVKEGLKRIFNLSTSSDGITPQGVGQNASLILTSAPYFIVMARTMIRDASDVAGTIISSVNQLSNPQFSSFSATAGTATQGLEQLRSSKIISFIQILADIGDLSLSMGDETLSGYVPEISISLQDLQGFYDNPTSHVRLIKNNGKVSYGTSTTPSSYLIPNEIYKATNQLGMPNPTFGVSSKSVKREAAANINRLPKDLVKTIENRLEAEYVPFYFHDLRTNEITSFHAFLESVDDSFDVEYEESSGYGRVDKVYNYKNTSRKLSFTFSVVATNEEDYDEMWIKINKLTTLLYPQWSAGRTVNSGQNKITQPFSQIPTNSPLIRVRIGDVIKSNYSKLALARLFGAGSRSFAIAGATQTQEQPTQNIPVREQEIRRRMDDGNYNVGERVLVNPNFNVMPARGRTPRLVFLGRRYPAMQFGFTSATLPPNLDTDLLGYGELPRRGRAAINLERSNGSLRDAAVRSDETEQARTAIVRQIVPFSAIPFRSDEERNAAQARGAKYYGVQFETRMTGGRTPTRDNQIYLVSTTDLHVIPQEVARLAQQTTTQQPTLNTPNIDINDPSLIQRFFSPENNSIVRAFESTSGKGLAGFIQSMGFNWMEFPWETNTYNGRAPKIAKVQVQFNPIHDINPGIDAYGLNRAPIYNVGKSMKTFADEDTQNEVSFDTAYNFGL